MTTGARDDAPPGDIRREAAQDGTRRQAPADSVRREAPPDGICREALPDGVRRELVGAPHPVLTARALPVDPTDPQVVAAAADLLASMRRSRCTGLAAPQIGLGWRLFSIDVSRHPGTRSCAGELVVANPRLVAASHWATAREGCLSVPGLTGDVSRATRVTIQGSARAAALPHRPCRRLRGPLHPAPDGPPRRSSLPRPCHGHPGGLPCCPEGVRQVT
nr:hypothetical protein GCM10020093_062570 [Planobispora longispora]